MSLQGKTLFISGASRGIGLAIAKRAAQDGANVAIAAKTAEPHPKLPGTIYTAAKEIEGTPTHQHILAIRESFQGGLGIETQEVIPEHEEDAFQGGD